MLSMHFLMRPTHKPTSGTNYCHRDSGWQWRNSDVQVTAYATASSTHMPVAGRPWAGPGPGRCPACGPAEPGRCMPVAAGAAAAPGLQLEVSGDTGTAQCQWHTRDVTTASGTRHF